MTESLISGLLVSCVSDDFLLHLQLLTIHLELALFDRG